MAFTTTLGKLETNLFQNILLKNHLSKLEILSLPLLNHQQNRLVRNVLSVWDMVT